MRAVSPPGLSLLLSVLVGLTTTGCASYRASRLPTYPVESFRSVVPQGDLALGAELWYSKAKSKLYFDTNLTRRALAPVHVALVNRGSSPVKLRVAQMHLVAGNLSQPASPVSFDEAADRMRRKSVGPAIAWGILGLVTLVLAVLFVPIGSALAISQTASVNDRLKQDAWAKSLKDADLLAGQEARGVVFFEVPRGVKRLTDARLRGSVSVSDQADPLQFDIPLP